MNRPIAKMVLAAFGILVVFAQVPAFSQCNLRPDPTPKIAITAPGERVCCSLGVHSGVDPTKLMGHTYGNEADLAPQTVGTYMYGGEPDGYIYTAAAGLVDLGHVRDNADMVFYVYSQLAQAQHTVFTSGGDAVGIPNIPAAAADQIKLAGAIVFVSSWAHELTTWGDTNLIRSRKAQDFSAFSPEDMSSNIVGIEAAEEALNNGGGIAMGTFDTQMDLVLTRLIRTLGPSPEAQTDALLTQVEFVLTDSGDDLTGKWWMYSATSALDVAVRLLRRNFDGLPWKIPGAPQAAAPPWLNTTGFSALYPQFLYFVSDKTDVDATQVPNTNAYARNHGLLPVQWVPTPGQTMVPDAIEVTGNGYENVLCLATPKGVVIKSGQYVQTKVHVTPTTPDLIWTFDHATTFLRTSFTAVNPNMDGPVKYVAPDIPKPVK